MINDWKKPGRLGEGATDQPAGGGMTSQAGPLNQIRLKPHCSASPYNTITGRITRQIDATSNIDLE